MAVAGLGLQLTDYQLAASAEINASWTAYADLDTAEQAEIDRLVLRAERTLWLHPPVDPPHVWSCLRDPGLLDLWSDVAVDAAVTVTQTSGTLTAAGGTPFYETMVGKVIAVTTEGNRTISGYTSSTVVTVTPATAFATPRTFSIASDGVFRLPTDFESPESSTIPFVTENWIDDVQLINEKYLTRMRAADTSLSYPRYASIRWVTSDGTAEQQQELVTYPEPNKYYQVSLPYMAQPQGMTTANPYPRGGPEMADLLLSAVLAICEEAKSGRRGEHWGEFRDKCRVAVARDKARHHNFIAGYMRPDGARQTGRLLRVRDLVGEASYP